MSLCAHLHRMPSKTFQSSSIVVSLRRSSSLVCNAKKGKKKGGKQQKGSLLGNLADKPTIQPWQTTDVIMQHLLMVESYRRAAGKPLMANVEMERVADIIYEAPFAIMAHNRFSEGIKDEESVFTYGNKAALNAFQAENFGDFVGQLSSFCVAGLESETVSTREVNLKRLVEGLSSPEGVPKADTAPAGDDQSSNSTQQEEQAVEGDVEGDAEDEERERQVGAGWDANVLSDTGWRIGLNGRKVYIEFELFNIFSPTGAVVGQAACFSEYKLEDGTLVKFGKGGEGVPLPNDEDLAAAERAIEDQGEEVRRLKEAEGKGNSDPDVKEAVAELIKRKDNLAALREAKEAQEAKEAPEALAAA